MISTICCIELSASRHGFGTNTMSRGIVMSQISASACVEEVMVVVRHRLNLLFLFCCRPLFSLDSIRLIGRDETWTFTNFYTSIHIVLFWVVARLTHARTHAWQVDRPEREYILHLRVRARQLIHPRVSSALLRWSASVMCPAS
jgi:hypothetical protein